MDLSRHEQRMEDRAWRAARFNRRWMLGTIILIGLLCVPLRFDSLLIGASAGLTFTILGGLWVRTRNLAAFKPISIQELVQQSIDEEQRNGAS